MKEETWSSPAQDEFNNLSIIYKKKENKFIKNYQHFITMRNKELGIIEQDMGEDEGDDLLDNNDDD